MSDTTDEDVVIIINSYAKGNFKLIRKITDFLKKYDLHVAVNGEINNDLPPVIIEIHIFNIKKRYMIPQLENFIKVSNLNDTVKLSVIDKEDSPSFTDMAKSFGQALFSTGKQIAQKAVKKEVTIFVTAEQKDERQKICDDCPFYNHKQKRCRKCGCKMIYKTGLKIAKCPMNKWPEI